MLKLPLEDEYLMDQYPTDDPEQHKPIGKQPDSPS